MTQVGIEIAGKPAIADEVALRQFKGGSLGYFSQGKVLVNGERYQAQVTLTLIGSKELSAEEKARRVAEAA